MMYCIAPILTNNYSTTDSLNDTISCIDKKIGQLALFKYNNVRFAFQQVIDYDLYEDLLIYKQILLDKLLGCNCLDDQFLIQIISKIKLLTR